MSEILAANAVTIRDFLKSVSTKLETIASAAREQVAVLDEALSFSQHQPTGLSQRQLQALSDTLTEKVVQMPTSYTPHKKTFTRLVSSDNCSPFKRSLASVIPNDTIEVEAAVTKVARRPGLPRDSQI